MSYRDALANNYAKLASKIEVFDPDVKKQSLNNWLQHVALVLAQKGVTDDCARVQLAATYLRGSAANCWMQAVLTGTPQTWLAFTDSLKRQHDGAIPPQKARNHLMNFKVLDRETIGPPNPGIAFADA